MIYLKLEYMEMDSQYALFAAMSDNVIQKDFRTAVRVNVMDRPNELAKALRRMAEEIERKFS